MRNITQRTWIVLAIGLIILIFLLSSCRVLETGVYSLNTIYPTDSVDYYEWKLGRSRIITKGIPESSYFGDSLFLIIKHKK